MTLGDIVKEYRTSHDLSMDAFASVCGLSKGYISMLEKNQNPQTKRPIIPSIDTYRRIAKGMGIPIEDLMGMVGKDEIVDVSQPVILNDHDKNMVEAYHRASDDDKQIVDITLKKYLPQNARPQIEDVS